MVEKPAERIAPGTIVDIEHRDGQWAGRGFYNGHSRITLRVLTMNPDELLDAARPLVEGQLQRLEPPADLLRPDRLLQEPEPVGHRRLEDLQPAAHVVGPHRLLQPGQPLADQLLQGLEPVAEGGAAG